jgi:integrase
VKRRTAQDIDFAEIIKDTDRRFLPLKEDVSYLLAALQNRRPEGYPYVFVPPKRYDHIQQQLRPRDRWSLSGARNKVIHNFTWQFYKMLLKTNVDKGTFHDIRRTAITNWLRQGLSEYDVMTIAGHSNFETTHQFYLAVATDLVARARQVQANVLRQNLVHFGATTVFEALMKKADKHKCLPALNLEKRGRRGSNPQPSDRQSDALAN